MVAIYEMKLFCAIYVPDVAMNVGCFTEQQTADSGQQTDSRRVTALVLCQEQGA
jgi:hypothetical protein